MKDDPFNRLFPPDLSEETVDALFEFLIQLTDTFIDMYADQISRTLAREAIDPPEPPDDVEGDFDDDVPF